MLAVLARNIIATLQFSLSGPHGLVAIGATLQPVEYKGRKAVRMTCDSAADTLPFGAIALVPGGPLHNGTIQLQLAATRAPDADTAVRGFAGVAFRSTSDGSRFESFYLRSTNARANDQLRRNHTLQYQSRPDAPWYVLRRDSPGRYESYAAIAPGEWTTLRIVVRGTYAALYVNGAHEPSLIVNDLKLGDIQGLVGLWVGHGTIAYFSRLAVTPSDTY